MVVLRVAHGDSFVRGYAELAQRGLCARALVAAVITESSENTMSKTTI